MRKLMFVAALTAAVALWGAGTALGASVFGVGGGWMGFVSGEHVAHFSFSGHEGPNGDFGQVHWNLEDPDFPLDVKVDVDCVNIFPSVFGGAGWLDGPITSVSPQPNFAGLTVGSRLAFEVVDGGEPSGTTLVDEFDAFPETLPCKLQPLEYLGPDVSEGNIVVHTG